MAGAGPNMRNALHGGIFHPTLRRLQHAGVQISPLNIMYPIFISDDDDEVTAVASMPGVKRYGVARLLEALEPLAADGLEFVLLFGVPEKLPKDARGSGADSKDNPVIRALPIIKARFPRLVVACDVCLCPYTSHGHCGTLTPDGRLDHMPSIERIADVALAYALAGADVVAPSDMNDNRIMAIKRRLFERNVHNRVSVLSYSCKFASALYGPFRDAAKTAPQFGDRKCYQLPPGSASLAARAADRDVDEGADMLMVKPGLPYLDIVKQTKDRHPNYPLFVYQVSGEYSMLMKAGEGGNLKSLLVEVLFSMRRAGADCIITYFAPLILKWLKDEDLSI